MTALALESQKKMDKRMWRLFVVAVAMASAFATGCGGSFDSEAVPTLALVAGSPTQENFGSTDAGGASARFLFPTGLVADRAGNVYVADAGNNTIRKISSSGAVTTLAGLAQVAGAVDGTGAVARFNNPFALAIDGNGTLYVADSGNHTIRKVSPAGDVTTLAGLAGAYGSVDAAGASARFYLPTGVAVDSNGNIFVSDFNNHSVRKITPAGLVSTFAGAPEPSSGGVDGVGGAARFNLPTGIAVDASNNVYVSDFNDRTVRKITPAGSVTTLAGLAGTSGSTDGTGAAARFGAPWGLTTDSGGNLYVADDGNRLIRKITADGEVTTVVGTTSGAQPILGEFTPGSLPGSLASRVIGVTISGRTLYLTTSNAVAKADPI